MNHSDFFKLIRNGLPCGVFILHGEEEYVKAQAVKLCVSLIPEDLRPFNVKTLVKPSIQEVSEACETLPLFADRRMVTVYELAEGDAKKLIECFGAVPNETLLLVVIKGKLNANSPILKYALDRGCEVLFDILSPNECARWCMRHANQCGVLITQDTAQLLVRSVGTDMANLVSETDKLIDFVGAGGTVSAQDISVCVKAAVDVRIFDMLGLFVNGKTGDGIIALHALMDEGNEPMSISSFLSSRFKLMLEARRGIDAGRSKREIVSGMDGKEYANSRIYEEAKHFSSHELMDLISELSDTAFMKISGRMKDEKYLELVLLKHCKQK